MRSMRAAPPASRSACCSRTVNVAGVAPIMIRLAERNEVVTISGLGWWPKAAAPISSCAARRQDAGRRAAHRRAGGARRLDHRARATTARCVRRRGGTARSATPARASPCIRAWPTMIARARGRYRPLAVQRGDLPARRPAAARSATRFVQTDLAAHAAVHGRPGARRARGAAGWPGCGGARCVLPRRHRRSDRRATSSTRAAICAIDDLAEYHVAIEPAVRVPLARLRGDHLRAVVPGPGAAAGAAPCSSRRHRRARRTTRRTTCTASPRRESWPGRPRVPLRRSAFVDVPIDELLDPDDHVAARASRRSTAARRRRSARCRAPLGLAEPRSSPGNMAAACWQAAAGAMPKSSPTPPICCAVDRWGNAFRATPSRRLVTAPVVPGLGIMPSGRGSQSRPDPAPSLPAWRPASGRGSRPTRRWW